MEDPEKKYSTENKGTIHEDLPLSTAYNLTPVVEPDVKTKTFMDIHGKLVLVSASGVLAAVVTLALIIDILMGTPAVCYAMHLFN